MSDDATQPLPEWTDLCALSELPPQGQGKYIACKQQSLAVFRQGEGVRVMHDTCPHAGGSSLERFHPRRRRPLPVARLALPPG